MGLGVILSKSASNVLLIFTIYSFVVFMYCFLHAAFVNLRLNCCVAPVCCRFKVRQEALDGT